MKIYVIFKDTLIGNIRKGQYISYKVALKYLKNFFKNEEKYYKKSNPLYSLNWISDNEFNLYLNDIKQNMNYKIEEEDIIEK